MKTKTISILFALVMILSLSVCVFAQEEAFEKTWDEETVVTVFSDLDLMFPDLFAPEDSDYLWEDEPTYWKDFQKNDKGVSYAKDITLEDLEPKAGVNVTNSYFKSLSYDACGDGLIKYDLVLVRDEDSFGDPKPGAVSNWVGPERTTYIRKMYVEVTDTEGNKQAASVKTCSSSGGDSCRSVKFNKAGEAHLKGYIYAPQIMLSDKMSGYTQAPQVSVKIWYSNYKTPFYEAPVENPATVASQVAIIGDAKVGRDYCQPSLQEYSLAGMPSVRAKYDQNTGEARFQATIINGMPGGTEPGYAAKDANYVIPAEVRDAKGNRYTGYTCKYTIFNTANAAPRTDYCKFGEGIYLAPHAVIRFDITIDKLNGGLLREYDGKDIPFTFRVGGLTYRINSAPSSSSSSSLKQACFEAVRFPCPPVSRLLVKDPLYPFMGETDWDGDGDSEQSTFYGLNSSDKTISASGGVYKNGVWGIYQKCGKYAFMAVRLKNDGVKDETINLKKVAVAINGGTPVEWKWVLSSQAEESKGKIVLEPGDDVFLMLRAKVTDYPYQLNADTAMTGAVNFLDFGFYITGSVYSDHNNTRCVAAPK